MWDTPDDIIRRNMEVVIAHSEETEIRRHFLVNPHDALDCLMAELRLYRGLTLKHHWPQIISVLEGDILYQARQLALNGAETMFSGLSPRLWYCNSEIKLDKPHHIESPKTYTLDGDGLQLVPSIFEGEGVAWQIVPEWRPMVIYGARGIGLWFRRNLPEPEKALQLALGAGRAKVLQALQTPTPTGELARQLKVTSGAISQQLHRLQKAGLVESHRNSNKVYYQLTARGENLLTLFMAS
jgi:DNA-binding HxlR family transcriptional regulator